MDKPIIRLWQINSVCLIISHPTGVLYSNQTGGYACLHPEAEGALVPLHDELTDLESALREHFWERWKGGCWDGIDGETADFIDSVLASSRDTSRLNVDRAKLADSHEAWVYVTISEVERDDGLMNIFGFPSGSGIMTWANSD